MRTAHELALIALAHIEGLVRHVPEGQEAGQEERAAASACDQVGRIQKDCDDGSDGRTDSESEVSRHGLDPVAGRKSGVDGLVTYGALPTVLVDAAVANLANASSTIPVAQVFQRLSAFVAAEFTLQDISPDQLWDALVTAIEEGEAHGSGLRRRVQRVALAGIGSRRVEIDAFEFAFLRETQVHHSSARDAVLLPVADAGHGEIEDSSNLGSTAERLDNLDCMGIHGPYDSLGEQLMQAYANIYFVRLG